MACWPNKGQFGDSGTSFRSSWWVLTAPLLFVADRSVLPPVMRLAKEGMKQQASGKEPSAAQEKRSNAPMMMRPPGKAEGRFQLLDEQTKKSITNNQRICFDGFLFCTLQLKTFLNSQNLCQTGMATGTLPETHHRFSAYSLGIAITSRWEQKHSVYMYLINSLCLYLINTYACNVENSGI